MSGTTLDQDLVPKEAFVAQGGLRGEDEAYSSNHTSLYVASAAPRRVDRRGVPRVSVLDNGILF